MSARNDSAAPGFEWVHAGLGGVQPLARNACRHRLLLLYSTTAAAAAVVVIVFKGKHTICLSCSAQELNKQGGHEHVQELWAHGEMSQGCG